ncbi:sulfite exporter TauE/SafE family protein [Pseudomonas sp. FP597]|uniref:sulfite exporter TauE/SafE family protein n=1 Tax=Pseudomonas sp. FP597 TaxID=2954096 RepID=UPI0027356D60|nr:sulfite exporter TauE/SafE family protein [Pseudomonas sp. FP597]WLI05753.1 sulfite exporter TauE/SafE family protein [Pseudomonas sp. FP597]
MNTFLTFYQNLGPTLTLLVIATFLLAGAVKGVIGMGLPTVAMGLLGLAMLPAQAAALLIIPSTVTNLWQLAFGGHLSALLKRLWPMLLLIFLGTGLGTVWLGMDGGRWVVRALGGALLVYALSGLFMPTFKVKTSTERWFGPVCGLITGLITSATGVFVIPAVPYLQALGLNRDQLVQALGLSFTVSTLALAAGLAWRGTLGGGEVTASLLALVPALLGMWLGQALRQRISAVLFKRIFFIGMALLGAHLLISG